MTERTAAPEPSTLDGRRASCRMELDADGTSYRCVRTFGAPPDRVFRAFTDPEDLRVWFPAGAPPGSRMTVCESDPVEGGTYRFVIVLPEHGPVAWHGTYTGVDRPGRLAADERFVAGDGDPSGPATSQTLTFAPTGDGLTLMTMRVELPEPEDPEAFVRESAAGLNDAFARLDEIVSVRPATARPAPARRRTIIRRQ